MPNSTFIDGFVSSNDNLFTNWHKTITDRPTLKRIDALNSNPSRSSGPRYNESTREFQKLIREALHDQTEIRALGGAWSFSEITATKGILVDTDRLTYKFRIRKTQTHPNFLGAAENLRFVQCGNAISTLNKYLARNGKSLKTTGASNGQTIAGAISTGTHGSAIEVGSISDCIRSIHLITSPDRSVWLERDSQPTVGDAYARNVADKVIRCDSMFNAALVSFGSFGIIHGVVIEVTDLFYLHCSKQFLEFNTGMWKAITKLDFSDVGFPKPIPGRGPYHVKIVIEPNNRDKIVAEVIYKYFEGEEPPNCEKAEPGGKSGQSDDAFSFVSAVTDMAGVVAAGPVSLLFRTFFKEKSGVCGPIGDIFSDTTTRGEAFSTAMGIPLERVEEALKITLKEYDHYWAPVIVALRYVRASKGTLAFTAHSPTTCILEVDGPGSTRVSTLTQKIWDALDAAGIPYTFHWGKLNNLSAANVRKRFGDQKVQSWLDARRKILDTTELRKAFANDFLRKLELHD